MAIEHAPRSEHKMSYEQAEIYAFMCNHDGKRGWRLPTFNEFVDPNTWYKDAEITKRKWFVAPVRDIK
jgi:hypothetical protein